MSAMTKSDVFMMLDEARSTLDSEGHCILADGVRDVKKNYRELEASYRKLAEREKALTEALGDAIDYVTDSTLFYKSVAALALHKEDA